VCVCSSLLFFFSTSLDGGDTQKRGPEDSKPKPGYTLLYGRPGLPVVGGATLSGIHYRRSGCLRYVLIRATDQ